MQLRAFEVAHPDKLRVSVGQHEALSGNGLNLKTPGEAVGAPDYISSHFNTWGKVGSIDDTYTKRPRKSRVSLEIN